MGDLRIIEEYRAGLREFILKDISGFTERDNKEGFTKDYQNGLLKSYEGTYVAYHRGHLIGHNSHRRPLADKIKAVHGDVPVTIYMVAKIGLEFSVNNGVNF
jgi:hypothetical protein